MARSLRHARDASPVEASRPKKAAGGLYKTAAIKVLEAEKRFMRSGEITKVAQKMGFFKECTGKTPEHTMASCLYQELKKGKKSNIFRPIGPSGPEPGLFGLRGWAYTLEDFKDTQEEVSAVPKRAKRTTTSVSMSDYIEEDDVYVPKGTTARTKKRSLSAIDECTDDADCTTPTSEGPLVWRSTRTRKRTRYSDTEDDIAEEEEYEKYAAVPDEQMRAHINLLLEAACELEESTSGRAILAGEPRLALDAQPVDMESEARSSNSQGNLCDAETSAEFASPSEDALPSTSHAPPLDTPRSNFTKVFQEVFHIPRGPPEPAASTKAADAATAAPQPPTPALAPVTPSTSDSHCDKTLPVGACDPARADPTEATSLKAATNIPLEEPLERKGSVSLTVELPFPRDQENCAAGTPNPVTPELFCRSMSTGSLPSAPVQQALTKSYSALTPMMLTKIRV
eukprot:CAMPEP_0118934380 /NCGR_PEP_ID=MMETSP1169-20130426/13794_1 /TAXON_ID=36882 /ORGANISM="Pyramimonas obovata, Strain CCMP722" /LENGTH=454 /DNA_ID=CAMNT_0006877283 /DNA_START=135 /DNA_END=1499 /DNA_ORIENTATION=-